jgi:hypothetical protein
VALGEDLGADKDAGRVAELAEHLLERVATRSGAAVDAQYRYSGKRSTSSSSSRSVPTPCGCSARLPQSGQAGGAGWRAPQWWHCRRLPAPCTVIGASQRLQCALQPQSWHSSTGA